MSGQGGTEQFGCQVGECKDKDNAGPRKPLTPYSEAVLRKGPLTQDLGPEESRCQLTINPSF